VALDCEGRGEVLWYLWKGKLDGRGAARGGGGDSGGGGGSGLVGVVPQMGDYGGSWRYAGGGADPRRPGSTPTKRSRREYGAFWCFLLFLYFFFPSGVRGLGFWGLAFRIGKTKLRGLRVWVFCMNFAESRVAKSSFLFPCFFVHEVSFFFPSCLEGWVPLALFEFVNSSP
jgi:hypothetical protein